MQQLNTSETDFSKFKSKFKLNSTQKFDSFDIQEGQFFNFITFT